MPRRPVPKAGPDRPSNFQILGAVFIAIVAFAAGVAFRDYFSSTRSGSAPVAASPQVRLDSPKAAEPAASPIRPADIDVEEYIRHALVRAKYSPNAAASDLETVLNQSGTFNMDLVGALIEMLARARRYDKSAAYRQKLLENQAQSKSLTATAFVVATAAIAQDLQHSFLYQAALATLNRIPLQQLDPTSKSIVLRIESDIHACTGDAVTALSRFEESKSLAGTSGRASPASSADDLLHRTFSAATACPRPSAPTTLATPANVQLTF